MADTKKSFWDRLVETVKAIFGADTVTYLIKKEFSKPLSDIPPGSIVIYRNNIDWFSSVIRKITKKWANHTGIYFGSGKHEVVEALENGIVKTRLDRDFKDKIQLIIIYNKNLTVTELSAIKGYAYGRVGIKYGYAELPNFILNTATDDPSADFCSEMTVDAYAQAGLVISPKPAELTSPGDVFEYILEVAGFEVWDTRNIALNDVLRALKRE